MNRPETQGPPESGDGPPPRLWADGRFSLAVHDPRGGPPTVVDVDRPYALVGRIGGADVRIDDRGAGARHAYLHLDRRGLFVVDLATRTGTRVGPDGSGSGWIGPGETFEVAGRVVELREAALAGGLVAGGGDPLADARSLPLVKVTLYPSRDPDAPLALGSEIVFLGRSPNCGVRIEGASASRTHCAIVRGRSGAFVVDLVGRGTWLNDRPLDGASALNDGDSLMIGSARFQVRIRPAGPPGRSLARTQAVPPPPPAPPPAAAIPEIVNGGLPDLTLPPGLVPAESQAAVLAWMVGVLQQTQTEMLRRQDEFQHDLLRLIGQMHRENTSLLSRHLEKVESINRELSSLRDEIGRRFGPEAPALPHHPPSPTPRPVPIPLPSSRGLPADPTHATQWLLGKVKQLEQENRSSWRDLFSRLGSPRR